MENKFRIKEEVNILNESTFSILIYTHLFNANDTWVPLGDKTYHTILDAKQGIIDYENKKIVETIYHDCN